DLLRIKKMSLKEKYKKAIEKCPNWEKKLKEEEVCIVKLYLDDCSYNEISNKTNMTNNQIKYKLSGLKRNNKGSLCDKILRKRKGTKHKKVIEDNLQPK
ncbi:MAG: hypothetical protein LIR50_17535, partial [Bacillota bacterium]|nr:hypothetical protein [Bacillota bacterium]